MALTLQPKAWPWALWHTVWESWRTLKFFSRKIFDNMLWFLIIILDNFILFINWNEDYFVLLLKVTGQNDRQGKNLTGQLRILAGHCPLTSRYFAPCLYCIVTIVIKVSTFEWRPKGFCLSTLPHKGNLWCPECKGRKSTSYN
jgi:hypothetical protein